MDPTSQATTSVFDNNGNLLAGAAAIIGVLTAANRIRSYRRFKKPSLPQRLFRLNYEPQPLSYRRSFRPYLNPASAGPCRTIRKSPPVQSVRQPMYQQPQFRGSWTITSWCKQVRRRVSSMIYSPQSLENRYLDHIRQYR